MANPTTSPTTNPITTQTRRHSGFEDDVAMLRDYCLVAVNETGDEFEMHGLVQLSTRKWLAAAGQQETFKQQYVERMAAAFPTGQYENWPTCLRLFAHVQAALEYRPKGDGQDKWATLLYNGGWYALSQGRYDVAEQMADKARKAREKRLGMEDPATLASTSLVAEVIKERGRWTEAETLFVQVMETCKTKLGADHPDTLTSMANLASTYRNQGRWDEAETLEVQVMETRKTKLGADHPSHADQHEQPGVDVLEPGPVGRGRDARGAGDGDSQDQARGGPS